MKIDYYIFSLVICFILASYNLQAQWIASQGLDGADVSDIIVLDSMLFICTNQNGLYSRNVNGGIWEQKLPNHCKEIEACQNALFAWDWYSCYRSLDQGATWLKMNNIWNIGEITSMCTIDSSLIISSLLGSQSFIYRSDDQGNTIYPVMNNLPYLDNVPNVAVGDSSKLFCFQTSYDNMLFQSINKGITWDTITSLGLPMPPSQNVCMSSWRGTMWFSTTAGLYAKSNDQNNWILVNDTLFFRKMGIMNGELFASSTEHGLYRFNPTLNQWIPENSGLESRTVNGFCTSGSELFVATGLGPYKCNTPYTWLPFYDGLNQSSILTMAFHNDETWVVNSRGTFISADQGATFTKQVMTGIPLPNKLILTDAGFYALASGSFYWSHDHGNTWTKEHAGLPLSQQPSLLMLNSLVCTGEYLFVGTNKGLYKSSCQRINWTKINSIGSIDPLSFSLYSVDSTLIAVKRVYTDDYNYYTYTSSDLGQTFHLINGLPTGYQLFFADMGIDFYGLSFNQLFKSQDAGLSWNQIPVGNSSIYGYLISANKPALIVGGSKLSVTLYDLYLSVTYDDGLSWVDIQDNLPVPYWPVMDLLETNQQRTFVSPSMEGLWYRDGLLTGFTKRITDISSHLKIYPNPAHMNAIIEFDGNNYSTLKLVNLYGVAFREYDIKGMSSLEIYKENLPSGIYLLVIKDFKGNLRTAKLIFE